MSKSQQAVQRFNAIKHKIEDVSFQTDCLAYIANSNPTILEKGAFKERNENKIRKLSEGIKGFSTYSSKAVSNA